MPGRDQCPKQTGSDVRARGDLRGRGTQKEYDRKGKDSLYPEKVVLTNGHIMISGRDYQILSAINVIVQYHIGAAFKTVYWFTHPL